MRRILQHGCFVVLFVAIFATGYRGIDFGGHWDEPHMRRTVHSAVLDQRLLPGWYNYPSVTYGIVVASLLPDIVEQWRDDARTPASVQAAVFDHLGTLRVRTAFLAITMFTLLWTYLTVLSWRRRWGEAILAAAILGLSWEVAYHARWIAPDGILMQFGTLFLLLMVVALKSESGRVRWLTAAAVTAGFACGTKYPGGILLFPLLYYAFRAGGPALSLRLAAVFALTFLLTTPGAVLDLSAFVRDVGYEVRHYAAGHPGYSVSPGPQHIALMAQYFFLVALSKYPPLALVIMAFVVVGCVRVWRSDRWFAGIVLWLPLAYFIYMGMQRVMFVRNLLILMPVLAILSARGMVWSMGRLPGAPLRAFAAVVVALALAVNYAWLVNAASSIASRDSLPRAEHVIDYLNAHPGEMTFVSTHVVDLIGAVPLHEFPADLTQRRDEARRFLVDTRDGYDRKFWPGNRFGRWHVVSGPFDVNFDYYPTWGAHRRILGFGPELAKQLGVIRGQIASTPSPGGQSR